MKPVPLCEVTLQKVRLHGIEGYFSDLRIDKSTIPANYEKFECRDTDCCEGIPCSIEKGVLVNFYGTFIVPKGTIDLSKEKYNAIYINIDNEDDCIDYLENCDVYGLVDGKIKIVKSYKFVL